MDRRTFLSIQPLKAKPLLLVLRADPPVFDWRCSISGRSPRLFRRGIAHAASPGRLLAEEGAKCLYGRHLQRLQARISFG
jgi:hypothetical protein